MRNFWAVLTMRIVLALSFIVLGNMQAVKADDAAGWTKYSDPQGRFTFSYPSAFGMPEKGSNDGFGDRVAAIRFSEFSAGMHNNEIVLGGEAAVTKGFVMVDVQALGGLYDAVTLEIFPGQLRNNVISNLPALTVTNFPGELAKGQHLDVSNPALASFSQQVKDTIVQMDQARNIDPKVIRCDVDGDTVTFDKEVTAKFGQFSNRQHIYGAIRFLKAPFSSFQIIRATNEAPAQEMLKDITSVVKSFEQNGGSSN